MQVPIYGHLLIIHLGQRLRTDRARCTWCRAVRPSTLAVSMSVPLEIRFLTSSLSPAAQAARNTQPSLNPILLFLRFKSPGSRNVSLSCHRFNCSALFIRAELDLVSSDMLAAELGCPPAEAGLVARSHHLVAECRACCWLGLDDDGTGLRCSDWAGARERPSQTRSPPSQLFVTF